MSVEKQIEKQIGKLGAGTLTEHGLKEHIWPLFSRVMAGDRFRNEIYLANHSLGRPLDQMAEDINEGIDIWYRRMDGAWGADGWLDEMNSFRNRIAQLIGIGDSTAVVPKSSAGQGLRAVLNALPRDGSNRPVRVLATRAEFDSIDFILKTYSKKGRAVVEWVPMHGLESNSGSILKGIHPGLDLIVVSMVVFATGEILTGMQEIVQRAHEAGAMVLLDTYHAAGVVPIDMTQLNADFMIGGSYKYTRGGPGVCWLAIHPRLLGTDLRTLDTGWFAKKEPFGYERSEEPLLSESGDAWLESTPPIVTFYQARSGLEFTLAIGVNRLREYNLRQQKILRDAFSANGVVCIVPTKPEHHGPFSLVPVQNPHTIVTELKAAGVNTDSRGQFVRFGPDILNSQSELLNAASIMGSIMNRQ